MNLQDWKMLAALYETENITQAAHQLFVSQPTLTARIQKLESHYGVSLVLRKRRGISFTPEGEELAKHARRMLLEQRKMEEKLNNMQEQVKGTLRVGVSNFFAANKMPKLLQLFKEKYPEVECQVITGWSSEMHRRLLNHDVHVSFIKGNYSWNGKKELLYEEEICVASPWNFQWEELPELPRVDYYTDEHMRMMIDDWWHQNYMKQPNITIHVNQVETCKEMIIHGLGYAIVANLVVRPYKELFIKPITSPSGEVMKRQTWMYYQEDVLQMNIVRAFIEFVKTINVKAL